MEYVLGTLAVVPLVAAVIGAVKGKVRMSACCSIADPANDLRMRDAFAPDHTPAVTR